MSQILKTKHKKKKKKKKNSNKIFNEFDFKTL